jgi:hypothetical protein
VSVNCWVARLLFFCAINLEITSHESTTHEQENPWQLLERHLSEGMKETSALDGDAATSFQQRVSSSKAPHRMSGQTFYYSLGKFESSSHWLEKGPTLQSSFLAGQPFEFARLLRIHTKCSAMCKERTKQSWLGIPVPSTVQLVVPCKGETSFP